MAIPTSFYNRKNPWTLICSSASYLFAPHINIQQYFTIIFIYMFNKYSKRISLFHYLFPLDVAYLPKSTLNLNPIRNPCCLPPIFPSLSSACLISYLDKLHRNSCFFFPKSMTLGNNSDSWQYVLGKWGVTKHYYSLLELTSISNSQFSPHTSDFPTTWSFLGTRGSNEPRKSRNFS